MLDATRRHESRGGHGGHPTDARGILPRRTDAGPAPSPALSELHRLYDAVRELDVERLPPHERRAALRMLEGMRSLTVWYAKRVLERLHWDGPER